jgi:pimeloyl-ACP methyl ester carboxylesterase
LPYIESGSVQLYYEDTGEGSPLVFIHEFSGDHRSWEPQVRCFSRRYRCITFDARGYPPSEVPQDLKAYSQDQAVADVIAVMDHLSIQRAAIVGLSMGGYTALHTGLRHPERVRALAIAGVGYGSTPDDDGSWKADIDKLADMYKADSTNAAASHARAPGRIAFQVKDPRGWQEFAGQLAEHPGVGAANTLQGVQRERPNLYDLKADLAALDIPLLVMTGDEDEPCLEPGLFLKRTIAMAGLVVLPKSGHTINLEEPALFNLFLQEFLTSVDAERWLARDSRSLAAEQLGRR